MVYLPSESVSTNDKLASVVETRPHADVGVPTPIPFNQPFTTNRELAYVRQAVQSGVMAGDGEFTKKCHAWLKEQIGCQGVLLTHSCTAALEMSAILIDIQPGDEVIMPSYTFVSTANAVVLRGGVPVFVDIRPDTLNLDETQVEAAITVKTKAIMPVHYAGVSCEMDPIMALADQYDLLVIEDAAQGILANYHDRPIGSLGHMACLSFHATKNIVSGEGGALLINDARFLERAEIIREKGTNRSKFFRGEVDKYTWVDVGSSYLPSDVLAALLWAQFEQSDYIIHRRFDIWNYYHSAFAELERQGQVSRPQIPAHCQHNAHIYYLMMPDLASRTRLMAYLKSQGIQSTFHYVPLHSAPAGLKYGRTSGDMTVTEELSDRLVRLPLASGMTVRDAEYVASTVLGFLSQP